MVLNFQNLFINVQAAHTNDCEWPTKVDDVLEVGRLTSCVMSPKILSGYFSTICNSLGNFNLASFEFSFKAFITFSTTIAGNTCKSSMFTSDKHKIHQQNIKLLMLIKTVIYLT